MGFYRIVSCEESSLREGFFSRRSNLTTIATSVRFKIASFLAMTTFLLKSVNGSVVEGYCQKNIIIIWVWRAVSVQLFWFLSRFPFYFACGFVFTLIGSRWLVGWCYFWLGAYLPLIFSLKISPLRVAPVEMTIFRL